MLNNGKYVCLVLLWILVVGSQGYSNKFYCQFDGRSLCGMTQDTNDDVNWKVHKGPTRYDQTGPTGAAVGEYYIYHDVTHASKREEKTRIKTPKMAAGTYILTFKYNMYGRHIGMLNLFTDNNGDLYNFMRIVGNQWQGWHDRKTKVTLKEGGRVILESKRPNRDGVEGHLALDAIGLNMKATTTTTTTTIAPKVTQSVELSKLNRDPIYKCSFDKGDWCELREHRTKNTMWKMHTRESSAPFNIRNDGGFIYMDTKSIRRGEKASITLPYDKIPQKKKYCLDIDYYLSDNSGNSIDMELRWGIHGRGFTNVEKHLTNQANRWQHARIIINTKGNHYFAVTGVPGDRKGGIIAVDNVKVTPC